MTVLATLHLDKTQWREEMMVVFGIKKKYIYNSLPLYCGCPTAKALERKKHTLLKDIATIIMTGTLQYLLYHLD